MLRSLRKLVPALLVLVLIFTGSNNLFAAFNKYETKVITEEIEEAFKLLIDTWNEELYFEMYDFGQRDSQQRLTRGEFAQRMVELKWKPTLAPIKIDRIEILYLNYAVIYFWQEFENKVNVLEKVKKYLVFPVILENNRWKFDLTQLIRIPYEGKFKQPQPPKQNSSPQSKPAEKAQPNPQPAPANP